MNDNEFTFFQLVLAFFIGGVASITFTSFYSFYGCRIGAYPCSIMVDRDFANEIFTISNNAFFSIPEIRNALEAVDSAANRNENKSPETQI